MAESSPAALTEHRPSKPRPIVQLPDVVVNRIAAGEVVARPVNAVKELIENSIDAGSTRIQVSVALVDVGAASNDPQVLFSANGAATVSDNGCGIQKEDLPILCKRFTTSKLRSFEDLQSIMTHGFRGEALASISHVARLTVTTMMTEESQVGYRCEYMDGEPVGAAQPTAATPGTTSTVMSVLMP
ncbi:DNA mismatch repair protein, partial [Perkinsus olseni]